MNKEQEDKLLLKLHRQAIALRHARHSLAEANNFIAWHTAGHGTQAIFKQIRTASNYIDKCFEDESTSEAD